jgi:hypothetical protein
MAVQPISTSRHRAPLAVWIIAAFALIFIMLTCLLLLLAGLHVDVFSIGGRRVSPEEWLHVAAPLFVILALGFCAMLYAIAAGKRWWRVLLVALWCVIAMYGAAVGLAGKVRAGEAARAVAQGSALAALSWWFLYRTQRMRDYFSRLT